MLKEAQADWVGLFVANNYYFDITKFPGHP